ncbi:MAG: amidohydrolase [Clostridia bacterium]|nr:amidohydrolase [Clostridia bacterium]
MIVIKGGTLYTMDEQGVVEADLLIESGQIVKIDKNIEVTSDMTVIDAVGQLVFPGFVDAHCHLGLWEDAIGFEGADGNEITHPITPQLRAIDGINPMDRTFEEARNGGVTLVATGPGSANVIGGQFAAIKTAGCRIDDMIVKAPLAMKCAFGENPKRCYHERKQSPTTRMAIAAELRETLTKAREYQAKKLRGLEDESKMPDIDFKYEALLPVLERKMPLKAHAHRADDMLTALRIAKEFDLDITLDHCTEGHLIADILKAENAKVIVGPSFGERSKFELKNLTFETPGVLEKAGLEVAIMTDHPVIPLQHLPMCAGLSVKSGMSHDAALRAITIVPAKILGLDHQVGSLTVGKDADIVLWNGDPLKLESEVLMTLINGTVVYRK